MTLPPPRSEEDEASTSLLSDIENAQEHTRSTSLKTKSGEDSNDVLLAVPPAPIRLGSPDTLSDLSIDEHQQLQLIGSDVEVAEGVSNGSPSRRSPWRAKLVESSRQFWIRNKGLAYMFVAQFFGTLMNVTTRVLEVEGNNGDGLHPFQILFARMSITLALASGYMWYKKTPDFPFGMPEVRGLLVIRGFGGFFGVCGMYYALQYLPLADATVITFLAPGLACWACAILLKEPFTRVDRIAGLVSLVGVVLIARPTSLFHVASGSTPSASGTADGLASAGNSTVGAPGSDASSYADVTSLQRLKAVGASLMGVLGAATAYTTLRWIGKRVHPLISVNYFAAGCTIVSSAMLIAVPSIGFVLPNTLKDWGLLLFLGICGFTMQFLLSAALAYEKSSRATNITYTQMLFALTFDKVFFGHTPGLLSILGSSLILGSAIVVAMQGTVGGANKTTHEGSRMAAGDDLETGQDHDRVSLQEVQLRTLR